MAVRLSPAQDERTRARIQTTQLVKRLNDIAKGEVIADPALLNVQVRAALGLIAKTLPDLKATEHSAKDGPGAGGLIWIFPQAESNTASAPNSPPSTSASKGSPQE